jgi:hypothetical protein
MTTRKTKEKMVGDRPLGLILEWKVMTMTMTTADVYHA